MQEIRCDIFEELCKFELVCLPCSCYQKKDGTIPVPKDGLMSKLVEKFPNLPTEIGKGVEQYGNCPAVLSAISNTPFPTKFATFPVAPTGLRAEDPDLYVFQRLQGKFKKFSLLPGWTLIPRSDMVEFASIKLQEIMNYYRLSKVAIIFDLFTFDREDRDDYTRVKNIIQSHIKSDFYIITHAKENPQGTIQTGSVMSSVTYEED